MDSALRELSVDPELRIGGHHMRGWRSGGVTRAAARFPDQAPGGLTLRNSNGGDLDETWRSTENRLIGE